MDPELSWSELPTLCVSHVLEQLSCPDALAASSTCQNWRAALSLYNASRESLRLVAHRDEFKKNLFLAQLFRKNVKRLTVVLQCRSIELEKFVHFVLMRFCEAKSLQDIEFVAAPQYMRFEEQATIDALRSVISEPLFNSQRELCNVNLHGCGNLLPTRLQEPKDALQFYNLRRISATNIRRVKPTTRHIRPYPFPYLQYIGMDYSYLDQGYVQALARLPFLRHLSLNLYELAEEPATILWSHLFTYYKRKVDLTLNIINLTATELERVRHFVLAPDMPLTVVRVFFCKTIDLELVQVLADQYNEGLREFLWVDAPNDNTDDEQYNMDYDGPLPGTFINPLIMMCWQCTQLQSLVMHGYWLPSHDIIGMARLRPSLSRLEVSAILPTEDRTQDLDIDMDWDDDALPFEAVYTELEECSQQVVDELKEVLSYDWEPATLDDMSPALTCDTTKEHRYNYILQETTVPELT